MSVIKLALNQLARKFLVFMEPEVRVCLKAIAKYPVAWGSTVGPPPSSQSPVYFILSNIFCIQILTSFFLHSSVLREVVRPTGFTVPSALVELARFY